MRLRTYPSFWLPLVAVILCNSARASAQDEPLAKDVAAEPADVLRGVVRLPETRSAATRSSAWIAPTEFERHGTVWTFDARVPVEYAGELSIALASIDAARWTVSVVPPKELAPRALDALAPRRSQLLEDELPGWSVERWDLEQAAAGEWTVHVESSGDGAPEPGWVIVRGARAAAMSAWVSTFATVSDGEVAILAALDAAGSDESGDPDISGAAGAPRARALTGRVKLEVGGVSSSLELADDGLHGDGEAGDGVFGALVPRGTSGPVRAQVELDGVTAANARFAKCALVSFPMLERRCVFDGAVATRVLDAQRVELVLPALALGPIERVHVSAEVWGTNAAGESVPVCWLSRIERPLEDGARWKLALALDGRWLNLARALPPFELRHLRVQDPDTQVVFDAQDELPFTFGALPAVVGRPSNSVQSSMLVGASATSSAASASHGSRGAAQFQRALMLVHGYCSSGGIWPAADFTQPKLVFLDPNANRTHDQFAQLLASFGSSVASFGVVAHSQGGCAALHLLTYYQSGLDHAFGGRAIQSLATPYQGTPLASLGGFACGVNNDMTPAGSAAWLAGIPSWARAKVWFWTTSDAGTPCNALTNLFLTDPEDGTVEKARGQLPGGNSMGHATGWCHTTGMSYPAGYTDHARNQTMNANAAR